MNRGRDDCRAAAEVEAVRSLCTCSARPARSSTASCVSTCTRSSRSSAPDEGLTPEPARAGAGLGVDAHQCHQAGDAAPGTGHQHPDRDRRGAAFRAPQPADPVAVVSAGVQIAFLPFGEQALRHFMYLERPEGMTLADAEGFAAGWQTPAAGPWTGRWWRCPSSGRRWATCIGGSRPGWPTCATATARRLFSSGRRPRRPSPPPSSGRS